MTDNIEAFNLCVLRAIALLYESHPTPITLRSGDLSDKTSHKDDEAESIARGTLIWLKRNAIFTSGDSSNNGSIVAAAQLSARTLAILQRGFPEYGIDYLGKSAAHASTSDDVEEKRAISERLVSLLC